MAGSKLVVIGGVDTHGETHHAAVIDTAGRILGTAPFDASAAGYRRLLRWLRSHGDLVSVGVEGTGSYGAGLCRHLFSQGVDVIEVDRPDRRMRRRRGKSDPVDAEAAARSVLAGTAMGSPKDRSGLVESIRTLRVARSGAVKARTAAMGSLKAMITTAPAPLREKLEILSRPQRVKACAAMRPDPTRLDDPAHGTEAALRSLARRVIALDGEIAELDEALSPLVLQAAPRTMARCGIGVEHAGQLLVTVGENIERLHSEAAFAQLCGVAPMLASSGRTDRHRLNRGGDRQANRALHLAVIVRLAHCDRTRAYALRRTAEGLSKAEIIRCLKRYLAREVYPALVADLRALRGLDTI
ncbi:MAG: IS110 family transposase [Coriobacteriales bacterium]|nr:IS110 family transposase [Actinomycetes bacterium]